MTQQTTINASISIRPDTRFVKKYAPVFFAFLLGAMVIGAVGFASGIAHNAAHDTRHVMVFPCH